MYACVCVCVYVYVCVFVCVRSFVCAYEKAGRNAQAGADCQRNIRAIGMAESDVASKQDPTVMGWPRDQTSTPCQAWAPPQTCRFRVCAGSHDWNMGILRHRLNPGQSRAGTWPETRGQSWGQARKKTKRAQFSRGGRGGEGEREIGTYIRCSSMVIFLGLGVVVLCNEVGRQGRAKFQWRVRLKAAQGEILSGQKPEDLGVVRREQFSPRKCHFWERRKDVSEKTRFPCNKQGARRVCRQVADRVWGKAAEGRKSSA